eukprot:1963899-Lingulodinium_polyedra.AAC.1
MVQHPLDHGQIDAALIVVKEQGRAAEERQLLHRRGVEEVSEGELRSLRHGVVQGVHAGLGRPPSFHHVPGVFLAFGKAFPLRFAFGLRPRLLHSRRVEELGLPEEPLLRVLGSGVARRPPQGK